MSATVGEPGSPREAIRTLRVAYRSAVRARTQAANQLHALVVTAPDELRDRPRVLRLGALVAVTARMRPGDSPDTPAAVTRYTLRRLARRDQQLTAEADDLRVQMARFVDRVAPALVVQQGINTLKAAALLTAAGDNPGRLRSEGSFAHLCGVDASSGKRNATGSNRGGDRQANCALHSIVVVRMSHDLRTKNYVARRMAEARPTRGDPLPQALHRPRHLPDPGPHHPHHTSHLTGIGASKVRITDARFRWGSAFVDDAEDGVVVDDGFDVVERRIGIEPEVEAGLLRGGLGAAALLAPAQVLRDDAGAVDRRDLFEANSVGPSTSDDGLSGCGADVSDPLRLAGQGHQVVIALVRRTQDRETA